MKYIFRLLLLSILIIPLSASAQEKSSSAKRSSMQDARNKAIQRALKAREARMGGKPLKKEVKQLLDEKEKMVNDHSNAMPPMEKVNESKPKTKKVLAENQKKTTVKRVEPDTKVKKKEPVKVANSKTKSFPKKKKEIVKKEVKPFPAKEKEIVKKEVKSFPVKEKKIEPKAKEKVVVRKKEIKKKTGNFEQPIKRTVPASIDNTTRKDIVNTCLLYTSPSPRD